MYSLYKDDKKITYKGLADLYKNKYPDITESIIGDFIRDKNANGDLIINFHQTIESPIHFIDKDNLQGNRNK